MINVECCECGIPFCLTEGLYHARKRDGRSFTCPNGHHQSYRPTEDQKRITELEQRLRNRDRRIDSLVDQYDEVYSQRESLVGVLKECIVPGCMWRSRRQIARDPVHMGRGIERVRRDLIEHLTVDHAGRSIEQLALPERT